MHIYPHTNMNICPYIITHTHTRTNVRTNVHIYIHTHVHICIYTCIHTYTPGRTRNKVTDAYSQALISAKPTGGSSYTSLENIVPNTATRTGAVAPARNVTFGGANVNCLKVTDWFVATPVHGSTVVFNLVADDDTKVTVTGCLDDPTGCTST
jgi:hypothetical protein